MADVEDLMAAWGVIVSRQIVRLWVNRLVANWQIASVRIDRNRTTSGIWMKSSSQSMARDTGFGAHAMKIEFFLIFFY